MWVHADSFQLMNRTKQMLQDLSHTFDGLLQKHLNSVSHVYTSYLSALIQQLRVKINKDNEGSKNREVAMGSQLHGVQDAIDNFVHEPELAMVYLACSILAALNILTLIGLYNLCQSLVAWFLKNQIQHYRAFDQHPTQREENLTMSESRL